MTERLMVYEPGDRVVTMAIGGRARIWQVSVAGEWELRDGRGSERPTPRIFQPDFDHGLSEGEACRCRRCLGQVNSPEEMWRLYPKEAREGSSTTTTGTP